MATVMDSVAGAVPPEVRVTLVGASDSVIPVMAVEFVRFTVPVKLCRLVTVTAEVLDEPWLIVKEDGEAESSNPGGIPYVPSRVECVIAAPVKPFAIMSLKG